MKFTESFFPKAWNLEVYSISNLSCAQAYSHFLEVQSKFSRYKSHNLWEGFSGDSCYWRSRTLCYQIDRSWHCSFTAATSRPLKVSNCAAKLLPRASKAAQRFCSPLQLEWSCCLASKMLLNSCNLAVQLFWSDFAALYSACKFRTGGLEEIRFREKKGRCSN